MYKKWLNDSLTLACLASEIFGDITVPTVDISGRDRYLAEEALTFCSQYIEGIETRFNSPRRVDDFSEDRGFIYYLRSSLWNSIFPPVGKGLGAETFELSPMAKRQAHRYVLLNCPQVIPFVNEFKAYVRRWWKGRKPTNTEIEKIIVNPDISNTVSDELKFLADGPAPYARRFTSFNINSFKFWTTTREHGLKRQNRLGYFWQAETLLGYLREPRQGVSTSTP
nr:uncharacterized protein LOC108948259 [Nicotiana tomentosiformis]